MNTDSSQSANSRKIPWHLWVVGILALLWNGSGTYTIMMAQAGKLADLTADEAAYYAAQPIWFVAVTDIALIAAIGGAVALLLRSRIALWLFGISLAAIAVTDIYDLVAGTSRMLASTAALLVTVFIFIIALLELAYARVMRSRGILA